MKVIIKQPFGIGDILFLSPLVQKLDIESGVWPIVDHYFWVKDYIQIPNIKFIKQSDYNHQYYLDYTEIPFEHAHSLFPDAQDCMEAKYMLFGAPLDLWKTLSFNRNRDKENQLKTHLNISPGDKFIFVNNNFAGPEYSYKTLIKPDTSLRIINQEYIEGYTLLDWCGVLEQAQEIHTVSTALFFILESLQLSVPLHLYPRKPLDKDLSPIKSLISNKYICHE